MTYTFVFQNVEKPDSPAQNASTLRKVAANCDLGALNEANDGAVTRAIKKLQPNGWRWYLAGENALIFKSAKFTGAGHATRLIMAGGRTGASGSSARDKRRRGPSRYYQVMNFKERSTGKMVRHVNTHLIAKAFSTEKWRKPLHNQSVRNLRKAVQALRKSRPGWPIIVTGDMNTNKTLNLGPGFKRVSTPPTFGRQRYDHIYICGKVSIDHVRTLTTYSDHKGLKMRVHLL